jgi:hypothetical protein
MTRKMIATLAITMPVVLPWVSRTETRALLFIALKYRFLRRDVKGRRRADVRRVVLNFIIARCRSDQRFGWEFALSIRASQDAEG